MPQSDPSSRPSLFPPLSSNKNRAAWAGVFLTALGMFVTAILYMTASFASTKAWAAEEDQSVLSTIRTECKESYTDKIQYTKDVTILDERQQTIKKDVLDIKQMLKEMHDEMRLDRNSRSNCSCTRNNDTK
jgi:hypothetical protein